MKYAVASSTPNADAYARRIAARLTQASDELHHDIGERLRAAREQALAERKRPIEQPRLHLRPQAVTLSQGGAAVLGMGMGGGGHQWWRSLASAAWIAALLVGLAWVHHAQVENVTSEITEVDTALLTDELPPSAYADPGFAQFIKASQTNFNQ